MKIQHGNSGRPKHKVTKVYIAMRLMKWSALEINGRPLSRKTDAKVDHSIGFLPAYEALDELRKYWGGNAPYITAEILDE